MSHHDGFDAARTVSPLTTLVRGVIEWGFLAQSWPAQSWADLHAEFAPGCQSRKLSINAVCSLMVQVVAGSRRSVFAAFQADQALRTPTITASHQALYGKLGRMVPEFSCALVRTSAQRPAPLLKAAGCQGLPGWKGDRTSKVSFQSLPEGRRANKDHSTHMLLHKNHENGLSHSDGRRDTAERERAPSAGSSSVASGRIALPPGGSV